MYPCTLRAAASSSSSTGLGFALGRIGGAAAAPAGLAVPAAARGRSVSSTPAANAPVTIDVGVGMEQPKQQRPKVTPQDAAAGDENKRDDMHKTTWDAMTHSFGVGYSTRSDEEGFGGVYGRNDPVEVSATYVARVDVMTQSFGEGYSTRSEEEGFGGVYGRNDPEDHPGTEIHPSHPEYDTSQGSGVKEKEKARHFKDEKRATA